MRRKILNFFKHFLLKNEKGYKAINYMISISVIIPTKDREEDLEKCIDSIVKQEVLPREVIIVDDGVLGEFQKENIRVLLNSKNVSFQYFKKSKPSSAESRNIGANKASSDVVLILDDDVVLEKNYITLLQKEWSKYEDDPKLGGVGGVVKNLRRISFLEKGFNKIFCLSSFIDWDVSDVGFQSWNPSIKITKKVFYLSGGISSFRKKIIEEIPFRSLSDGRVALEDVDFFMKAKARGYYFIIVPDAKVFHNQSTVSRDNDFITGEKESYNRRIIYRDNVHATFFKKIKYAWSSIGWISKQLLGGHFLKGLGMIRGLFKKQNKIV